MHVPLVHRHLEMQALLNCNPNHFNSLRSSLGPEKYGQCLHLWTQVPRDELCDSKWLKESCALITSNAAGGKKHWIDWCNVVGWDAAALFPEEQDDTKQYIYGDEVSNSQYEDILAAHAEHHIVDETLREEEEPVSAH